MRFSTHHCHRTGDINFFSACMALGISPEFPEPAEVMQNSDGRDYLSFRLKGQSECGRYETQDMDKAWGHPKAFFAEFPNHDFSTLMRFIDHARGSRRKDDWVESIASFLGITRDATRTALRDVDRDQGEYLTATAPDSPLTLLACFVVNRFAAAKWRDTAIPKQVVMHGKSIVMVDGTMSKAAERRFTDTIGRRNY